MAKPRPALGGIFRLKGKNEPSVKLTAMSSYTASNSGHLDNSKGDNKLIAFSQFGNYRPKILSESENPGSQFNGKKQNNNKAVTPGPAVPSTSGEAILRTPRYSSKDEQHALKSTTGESILPQQSLTNGTQITNLQSSSKTSATNVKKGLKTKSSKNFILMGDKDEPIVLEKSAGERSLDGDELPEELPVDDGVLTFGEEDSLSGEDKQGAISSNNDDTTDDVFLPDTLERKPHLNPTVHVVNGHVPKDGSDNIVSGTEKEMPYIPPPDYDEDGMTMDISDEDDDLVGSPPPSHTAPSARRVYRVYQGDDFGQYLKEEESVFTSPTTRTKTKYKKSTPRSNQKNNKAPSKNKHKSLKGTLTKAIFGSPPQKDTLEENAKRHTIHEFSFGHSKIGLGDSSGIPKGVWNTESPRKLNGVSHQSADRQGNYELFLRSRQEEKKSGSFESKSDSGNETGEENNNSPTQRHFNTTNPVFSSPNKYIKRNGLWEKLTLRFRRRSRGEMGTVN